MSHRRAQKGEAAGGMVSPFGSSLRIRDRWRDRGTVAALKAGLTAKGAEIAKSREGTATATAFSRKGAKAQRTATEGSMKKRLISPQRARRAQREEDHRDDGFAREMK